MCNFKPGDEVIFVSDSQLWDGQDDTPSPEKGTVYLCESVVADLDVCETCGSDVGVHINDGGELPLCPCILRKVERKNDSLSIEAFLTIRPGFEEPKRTPAKKVPA